MGDVFLPFEEGVQRLCPLRLLLPRDGRIAVAGKVGEQELPEVEVIDEAGPARGGARLGELFLPREHVDECTLARVGPARDRDHGAVGDDELFLARGGCDEFCPVNAHRKALSRRSGTPRPLRRRG